MINTDRLLKATAAWTTIVYIVCFGGVVLLPGVRSWFLYYALHLDVSTGDNVTTVTTFLSGLLIWNVVALFGVWLFAFLQNAIKSLNDRITRMRKFEHLLPTYY